MITYLETFILNLAEVRFPLRTLLKKEFEFKLNKSQLNAIGMVKLLVTITPCLKIFNSNLQTCLKIDARYEGVGALLEQTTEPVCSFQSTKSPMELNSLLSKFSYYITWLVVSPD